MRYGSRRSSAAWRAQLVVARQLAAQLVELLLHVVRRAGLDRLLVSDGRGPQVLLVQRRVAFADEAQLAGVAVIEVDGRERVRLALELAQANGVAVAELFQRVAGELGRFLGIAVLQHGLDVGGRLLDRVLLRHQSLDALDLRADFVRVADELAASSRPSASVYFWSARRFSAERTVASYLSRRASSVAAAGGLTGLAGSGGVTPCTTTGAVPCGMTTAGGAVFEQPARPMPASRTAAMPKR